ncbi:Aste57867_14460 [Aphanomyces stellatus]|uniref:Aste57867_14460 protein n=1 Tax=Aphanomyces stellatus TaxID=120398 RepID=A0A485L2E6_9STRA|nr:hypothetical protein As57867_014406 [Aphanomyces stellatus]VFT91282.1 Aste57867_14460 [Aphanomyces stellatus]
MASDLPPESYLVSTKPPATLSKLLAVAKVESIVLATSFFYTGSSVKLYGESMRKALTGLVLDVNAARSFYASDVGLKVYQHPTYSAYTAKTQTPLSREAWESSILFHATKPKLSSLQEIHKEMQATNNGGEIGAVVEWRHIRGVFYTYDATEEADEMATVEREGRALAQQSKLPLFRLQRTSYSGPWTVAVKGAHASNVCCVQ